MGELSQHWSELKDKKQKSKTKFFQSLEMSTYSQVSALKAPVLPSPLPRLLLLSGTQGANRANWQGNRQVHLEPPSCPLALGLMAIGRARVPSWAHPQLYFPSPVGFQASPQKPESSITTLKHRINSAHTPGKLGHYGGQTITHTMISMGKCVLSSKQPN